MNKGDIVELKSGGRPMIVDSIKGTKVDCAWYEERGRVIAEFHIDSLEQVLSVDIDQIVRSAVE